MSAIADANYVSHFVGERLMAKGLLRSPVSLEQYTQGVADPDSKLVFLSKGENGFVVTVSPPLFPEVVAEECLKAAQMRSLLGDLGAPILEPWDTGRIQTSTYAVLPYRKPLSKRRGMRWIHRIWAKHLLDWILQVAQRRALACDVSRYEAALKALHEAVPANSPTAALVRAAKKHLESGRFVPRALPMHGDLWKGNVLQGVGETAFTLVDWRGSTTDGFPIFDLVRAAESFGLSSKALHGEMQSHRAALGCQMEDLTLYMLGALGYYAAHLGEMSPALFRTMSDNCARHLSSALAITTSFGPRGLLANGRDSRVPTG